MISLLLLETKAINPPTPITQKSSPVSVIRISYFEEF